MWIDDKEILLATGSYELNDAEVDEISEDEEEEKDDEEDEEEDEKSSTW